MSNPNAPVCAPRWFVRAGILALAAYAAMIACYFSTAAGGSDSSGYFNSARLFAAGEFQTTLRVPAELGRAGEETPLRFLPLGFWPVLGTTKISPTYPTGLPLHYALASKALGWTTGAIVVGTLTALAALVLLYAVARELGLGWQLAAAGAAILGFCPQFLFSAVQPLSDALATTWCLAAVWTALRARHHRPWAVATGAAFAVAVLVRPTNILIAPALVVLLGADWRRLALFGLGGLPGGIFQGVYNHALYGSALRSGYGSIFETFHLYWLAPTAWHFLKWLAAFLPAVLLGLPFVLLTRPATRTRELLALALWFGAIVGTYLLYEVSHEVWWDLRFILPALPALILGGLLGLEALAARRPALSAAKIRSGAALLLALWAAILGRFWTRHFFIMNLKEGERSYPATAAEVAKRFPPGTLVVTMTMSGAFYFYSDLPILRWDQIEAEQFRRVAAAAQTAGRAICAVDFSWEEKKLRERCPGNWVREFTHGNASIWRLAATAEPTTK
ncbi:MAG: hypothetical protein RLZZ15_1243 [Verrucomicrobiota bacterium]|jgi:hypothetical protein